MNGCLKRNDYIVQPPTVRLVSQWKWSFSCSFNFYQMKIEWKITKDCRHFCLLSEEKLFGFKFFISSLADCCCWQEQLCWFFKFLFNLASCSTKWFCPNQPLLCHRASFFSEISFHFPPFICFWHFIFITRFDFIFCKDILRWLFFLLLFFCQSSFTFSLKSEDIVDSIYRGLF